MSGYPIKNNKNINMKNTILIMALLALLISCSKEECLSCIAESKFGNIIETRLSCDSDSDYLNGFENGYKDRYKDIDSIDVHCANSY